MEIVSITVTVAMILIMIAVSFYLYIVYCHPEDKGLGTSLGCKIIIIVCQLLAWGQLLLLSLDISEGFENGTMELIYSIIYPVILGLVALVVPFIIFLYEADEEDSLSSRICRSFLYAIAISISWSAPIAASYIWLSFYNDPLGTQMRASFPMCIMICLNLVGWILLALNGSIGLLYLPYQMIMDFFNRPRQISSEQAYQQKLYLQNRSVELIETGQQLKKKQEQLQTQNLSWFSKRKRQSSLEKELQHYKNDVNALEQSFNRFDQQIGGAKQMNSVEEAEMQVKSKQTPLAFYYLSMILGVLAVLVSVCWVAQLVGVTVEVNGHPLFPFIDSLLADLAGRSISFVAVGLYSFMILYLQGCAIKGNAVFGLRIPFILRFHPMKKDKTYLNSFLFNVSLMMLSSAATTQLSVIAFPTYLQNTYIYLMFHQIIENMEVLGWLYRNQILLYAMEAVIALTFLVVVFQIIRACCKKKKQ